MNPKFRDAIEKVHQFCRQHKADAWNVPPEGGRFLYMTAVAIGAKRILEIGTSYGFSGLHLAAAAHQNGGRLITVDKDPRKVEVSGGHFEMAGLADIVEQHCGPAQDVVATLDGPFDLVFIDGVKRDCLAYFYAFGDKLSPRAVILTDNLTTHREADFGEFLPMIRNHAQFTSAVVPVGNGFEYTVKTA